jgi:hypothetical protein
MDESEEDEKEAAIIVVARSTTMSLVCTQIPTPALEADTEKLLTAAIEVQQMEMLGALRDMGPPKCILVILSIEKLELIMMETEGERDEELDGGEELMMVEEGGA